MNKRLEALLSEYGESHQNPVNMAIHWVCEPLTIWAVMAIAWCLPVPQALTDFPLINGLTALLLPLLIYFASLSVLITLGFLPVAAMFAFSIVLIDGLFAPSLLWLALPGFAVGWIALLIGHRIEGNFPSVFSNIHMLFLGPVWLFVTAFKLPPVDKSQ